MLANASPEVVAMPSFTTSSVSCSFSSAAALTPAAAAAVPPSFLSSLSPVLLVSASASTSPTGENRHSRSQNGDEAKVEDSQALKPCDKETMKTWQKNT